MCTSVVSHIFENLSIKITTLFFTSPHFASQEVTIFQSGESPNFEIFETPNVATPLWPSVGVKPNTWKSWELESSGTSECSELDSKGKNTSHWGVLGVIGKVLRRICRKCPRIDNLDICSPSYGQKKGRESKWQFDSRPLKPGIDLFPMSDSGVRHGVGNISTRATTLVQTSSRSKSAVGSYRGSKFRESRRDNFGTPFRESREFVPFGCGLHGELQRIL
jgi:hypothetical protein